MYYLDDVHDMEFDRLHAMIRESDVRNNILWGHKYKKVLFTGFVTSFGEAQGWIFTVCYFTVRSKR